MKSQEWLKRNSNDYYIKKAKKRGYFSRAAFKLIEIENKFKFIVNSNNILELGSSPGSWSQVIFETNPEVYITAFDLINMKYKNNNINFVNKNFQNFNFNKLKKKFDLILSDIAPNTTGHKATDHLKIASIIEDIIDILDIICLPHSNFVFKIWKGKEEKSIINKINKKFKNVTYFKPMSSRNESSEIFIVAENYIS